VYVTGIHRKEVSIQETKLLDFFTMSGFCHLFSSFIQFLTQKLVINY